MKKVFKISGNTLRNIKLSFQASMIVAAVFGFVFLSYLDLTRPESKIIEKVEVVESIS